MPLPTPLDKMGNKRKKKFFWLLRDEENDDDFYLFEKFRVAQKYLDVYYGKCLKVPSDLCVSSNTHTHNRGVSIILFYLPDE